MTMVLILLGLSLVTVLTIPYSEAIRLWRGGAGVWDESPELARPTWFQLFSARKLPKTIIVDTRQGGKAMADQPDGTRLVNASLRCEFPYDELPSAVGLWLSATYKEAQPFVVLTWRKPNGEEIAFEERTPRQTDRYFVSRDERLRERLQARSIEEALFSAGPRGNGCPPARHLRTGRRGHPLRARRRPGSAPGRIRQGPRHRRHRRPAPGPERGPAVGDPDRTSACWPP